MSAGQRLLALRESGARAPTNGRPMAVVVVGLHGSGKFTACQEALELSGCRWEHVALSERSPDELKAFLESLPEGTGVVFDELDRVEHPFSRMLFSMMILRYVRDPAKAPGPVFVPVMNPHLATTFQSAVGAVVRAKDLWEDPS